MKNYKYIVRKCDDELVKKRREITCRMAQKSV